MFNKKLMNKIRMKTAFSIKKRQNLLFLIFIVIYFSSLIYVGYTRYIWEDESYALDTSAHRLLDVVKLSYNFEGQPPFYFLLLAIWRTLNSSIFFARLLSILFIGLSAIYFHKLLSIIIKKHDTLWMVVIFLLNPFTVWAALEIRLYALVVLLSVMSIYYFFKFYIENNNKYLYIFLLISVFSIYTQYFFTLLIFVFAIVLWIFKGAKIFFKFCLYCIPVALLFLPNFLFLSDQLTMAKSYASENVLLKRIISPLYTSQDFMFSLHLIPLGREWRWFVKIFWALILLYTYLKYYKKWKVTKTLYFQYLNIVLLMAGMIMVLYSILIPSLNIIYQDKYMIMALPLFILLFTLINWFTTIKKNLLFVLLSLYFISLLILEYKNPIKTYDFREVAKFVEKIENKNEPILFFGKTILPPFKYYYSGESKLLGVPALKYDKNYYADNIKDTFDLANTINPINATASSYILITGSIVGDEFNASISNEKVVNYLKNSSIITLDTSFVSLHLNHTLRVQRFKRKE